MSLWGELRRRKVFQVAAVYIVVAWLSVQVVATVEGPLNLPPWTDTLIIVLVAVGFPFAIVLSWAYDITPSGIVRTGDSGSTEETGAETHVAREGPARESARVVASGRALPSQAEPSPEREPRTQREPGTQQEPGSKREARSRREILPNSVAVLPLENLSPNPDDEYFAAGIHEEILNYLTKIKDLSVIARTSVKKYAGTAKSISEIGDELGVETVMEGSVRYAGDRVRVTAQLIDAGTEGHLWSEVYERELADVFAIQADIASNIAGALEAKFSAADKKGLEALPTTTSSEAHALYLKSQALFGHGDTAIAVSTPHSVRARIQSELDKAIALDPNFAHPYALKALLYAVARIYDPVPATDWLKFVADADAQVRSNARRALELNAGLGTPHFALALNDEFGWRWPQARENYEQAIQLRPNDADLLTWYSTLEWLTEELDAAIRLARRAAELDPSNVWASHILAVVLHMAGQWEESAAVYEALSATRPESPLPHLHRALPEIALGHEAKAIDGLRLADQLMPDEAAPAIRIHLAYLYGLLELRDNARRIVEKVRSVLGGQFVDPIVWVMVDLALQDPERAIESFETAMSKPECRQEVFARAFIKDNAWSDPVLDRPEFAALRSRLRASEPLNSNAV